MSTPDAGQTGTDQTTEHGNAPSDETVSDEAGPVVHGGRLNQPWRAGIAGVECVLAVALVLFAVWSWSAGQVPIALPGPDGVEVVTRFIGSWLALSVAACVAASLLVLDAIRQLVLAVKVGSRRRGRAR